MIIFNHKYKSFTLNVNFRFYLKTRKIAHDVENSGTGFANCSYPIFLEILLYDVEHFSLKLLTKKRARLCFLEFVHVV